jgi:hypothetical protein
MAEAEGGRVWVHTEFWWGSPHARDHSVDRGVDWKVILKRTFREWGGEAGSDESRW